MKVNKSVCTEVTDGTIKNLQIKGQDFPTMVTVEYQVNQVSYEVTESLKLKSEMIKLGIFPVGQKRVPVMGATTVGSAAKISYNPDNPAEAFITDNVGRANV